MPLIQVEPLAELVARIFEAAGAPPDSARAVADSLVLSDLAGHESHGVVRVRQYLDQIGRGDIDPRARPVIAHDNGAVFLVDAHNSFGQIAASVTMTEAIDRAKRFGLSSAGLYHSGHVGRLAEWVEMAARRDAIAFAYCNGGGPSPGRVTPYGGADGLLGTNPIAAAVPVTGRLPIVLDFATSAVAEGKVRVARNRGKAIPEGWILNAAGEPTTNPNDLYNNGMLLPAAGHKGYALSLLVELVGGILAGNSAPGLPDYRTRNGVLFIVLDIAAFRPVSEFLDKSGAYADLVKAVAPAPGFAEVMLPGEPEVRNEEQRRAAGLIVDDATWKLLSDAAAAYGLTMPSLG
jgi:LDH2 family malate/lactate/ureidoglycolate dehydrogenase